MINLVCITGGGSVGKTTVINQLSNYYPVVTEAATDIIKEGKLHPARDFEEFQIEVAYLQRLREVRAIKDNAGISQNILCDRGLYDGHVFGEMLGRKPLAIEWHRFPRYPLVFLLEPLPFFEDNGIRFEDLEFTKAITPIFEKVYEKEGSKVIRIPPWPVEQRVKYIRKILDSPNENVIEYK